jgi:hypothetical protein
MVSRVRDVANNLAVNIHWGEEVDIRQVASTKSRIVKNDNISIPQGRTWILPNQRGHCAIHGS